MRSVSCRNAIAELRAELERGGVRLLEQIYAARTIRIDTYLVCRKSAAAQLALMESVLAPYVRAQRTLGSAYGDPESCKQLVNFLLALTLSRPVHQVPVDVRRQERDEVIHVAT